MYLKIKHLINHARVEVNLEGIIYLHIVRYVLCVLELEYTGLSLEDHDHYHIIIYSFNRAKFQV